MVTLDSADRCDRQTQVIDRQTSDTLADKQT